MLAVRTRRPGDSPPPAHQEAPARAAGARFVFVDALRGLAALWVLFFHMFAGPHLSHLEAVLPGLVMRSIHAGYLGVTVFFVLSGFVIAHSVAGQRVDASYAGWFVLRRSVRLDVAYWASIALTIAAIHHDGERVPGILEVLAHACYLQDILGVTPLSPLYWSLCFEMQLYIAFIGLLALAHHILAAHGDRAMLIVLGAAALVAAAWPLGIVQAPDPAVFFLCVWYAFLLGVLACWAARATIGRVPFYAYAGTILAAAIASANIDAVVAVVVAAVLLEAGRAGRLYTWLGWRPLQVLGTISYSLYLIQHPVSSAALGPLYHLTPRTASYELVWLVVLLAVNCTAAWLFWRLVERPCVQLSRSCKPLRRSS